MSTDRRPQLSELFHAALARDPSTRAAFLSEACQGDPALQSEVERLLAAHGDAGSFLEAPVGTLAGVQRLSPGASVGAYCITQFIGAGGMGEVYRARDTRLPREVAIKILPTDVAADPERVRRFELEAQAIASLRDSRICTLLDVGEHEGTRFLVMELLEGETLAQRLARKPLPIDQALRYGIEIGGALDGAHRQGIVHRDLKPGNVMLTKAGIKLLDFGLAKLRPPTVGAESLTRPADRTVEGTLIGTLPYMAPEQLEGGVVDARTDIWALGCVLYEMITGTQPFDNTTSATLMAAILEREPVPPTSLRPGAPPLVNHLVQACLAKDPEERWQSAADVARQLRGLADELRRPAGKAVGTRAGVGRWALATLGALALTTFLVWQFRSQKLDAPATDVTQLTFAAGIETYPSLSPDGKSIVYSREGDIYSQTVGGQAVPRNLTPDSPELDTQPAFSPDGEHIAFRSERDGGGIFLMRSDGAGVRQLTDVGFNPAWTPDGRHVVYGTVTTTDPEFSPILLSEVWMVDVATEKRMRISSGECMHPVVSPDSNIQRVACWSRQVVAEEAAMGPRDIITMRLDGGEVARVTNDAAIDWNPIWSHDGRNLYFASERGGTMGLWRVAIDEATGRATGDPQQIATPSQWVGLITHSGKDRLLAFANNHTVSQVQRLAFDPVRTEVSGPAESVTHDTLAWRMVEPSPDGSRLALASFRRRQDIYVAKADGTGLTPLRSDVFGDRRPHWSPQGDRIAFMSDRGGSWGLWVINPDGSGLRELVRWRGLMHPVWSPNGSRIVGTEAAGRSYVFAVQGEPAAAPQETLPSHPNGAFVPNSWSRDERRIAGSTVRAGQRDRLCVYAFATKTYQDLGPGEWPVWLNDSERLLYRDGDRIMLIDTRTNRPQELWRAPADPVALHVSLSRDNHWIYFTTGGVEADIWLLRFK